MAIQRLHCWIPAVALGFASTITSAQSAFPDSQTSKHTGAFNGVVMIGDSLSDGGNLSILNNSPQHMRFTTNPGHTSVEFISSWLGSPITPSLAGGSNFAYGGAGIIHNAPNTPAAVPTLPTQLQTYLSATHGKADPGTLYSLWGGSNDVFYGTTSVAAHAAAQLAVKNGTSVKLAEKAAKELFGVSTLMTADQARASLQQAANTKLAMIDTLGKAGARYIMVSNLPDIGLTPFAHKLGPDMAAQLTGVSAGFNNTLYVGLAHTDVNIIPVNTFGVLNEIVADPARYGMTNVTEPACTGGSSPIASIQCAPEGTPGATVTYEPGTQYTYLFADDVHPTVAAHQMLAQYAESIIVAPGQMSLLSQAPLAINNSLTRSIKSQMESRSVAAPSNGLRGWANYDYSYQKLYAQTNSPGSGNHINVLSIGADVHPSQAFTAGFAFTAGNQDSQFSNGRGSFKLNNYVASGYAMWNWDQAYVGAVGSLGYLDYGSIRRNIPIGPTVRHEQADTSGSTAAATLTGGWWFNFEKWRTGPYVDLTWQHTHVKGFEENSGDAMAMVFGSQNRDALITSIGWQMDAEIATSKATLRPFVRAQWSHDSKARQRDVSAGLVSMPGTFALPGFVPDKNWATVSVGLVAEFEPNFSGWIGYHDQFSDSSQRLNNISAGIRMAF
ncbi:autotransporter domain-containing protein [Allopusillimonas ginsengisoli]|uniref:autotransporter domain-containing protein n=1 Tax=Allopusillimonas ginsengisoli TaxID=453575 RepID=UPI0010C20E66|nr:autotransporter domain-containing protein [Allopusillimonas ginsengisoli]